MFSSPSQFRAGDLVEVRTKEEILATLDERGTVEGMPFMPEMLAYCGRRFRVSAVAHKTCETVHQTWQGRRLRGAVHLAGLRCDGSAHGGCQADCNLFWKDVWLRPVEICAAPQTVHGPAAVGTEGKLLALTRADSPGDAERYSCQATRLFEATQPLAWWNPRQYLDDILTSNHSVRRVVRGLLLAKLRWLLPRVPMGYRIVKRIHDYLHLAWSGRPAPELNGLIPAGMPTPTARLGLKPGDLVRVKLQADIEQTLDRNGKNRGLSFSVDEMAGYCGQIFTVRKLVAKILDERTGVMLHMKEPCVILEGVVCKGEFASCRLNCPRAISAYWRELWLERVNVPKLDLSQTEEHALVGMAHSGQRVALPVNDAADNAAPGDDR
jgi:hypothetical protein